MTTSTILFRDRELGAVEIKDLGALKDENFSGISPRVRSGSVVSLSEAEVLSVVSKALVIERNSESVVGTQDQKFDQTTKAPVDLESFANRLTPLGIRRSSLSKAVSEVIAIGTIMDQYEDKKAKLLLPADASFERVKAEEFLRLGVEYLKQVLPNVVEKLINSANSDPILKLNGKTLVLYLPKSEFTHISKGLKYYGLTEFYRELFKELPFMEKLIRMIKSPIARLCPSIDNIDSPSLRELDNIDSPAFTELLSLLQELKIEPIFERNLSVKFGNLTTNDGQIDHCLYAEPNPKKSGRFATFRGIFFKFNG